MPKINALLKSQLREASLNKQYGSMTNLPISSETSTADMSNGSGFICDIIDNVLQLPLGHYDESDSQPELQPPPRSKPSFVDRRLQYWKDMIRERRAMQLRLCRATGREPRQLLLNMDSIEEQNIRRILEHVSSTAPHRNYVEIVDIPRRMVLEQGGEQRWANWCNSELLKTRLLSKQTEIECLFKHFPETEVLDVFGRNLWRRQHCERISCHTISSTSLPVASENAPSQSFRDLSSTKSKPATTIMPKLALLINGTTYHRHRPEYSPILERRFVCKPFERSLRTVMRIENNGQEALHLSWSRAEFFANNDTLFNAPNEVFIFDTTPFYLRIGDVRELNVLFRPIKVGIVKQRWYLKTRPRIFYRWPCALTLNMHGCCLPPPEYLQLLLDNMQLSQPGLLAHSSPTRSTKLMCQPYSRELEHCEAFNQRNVSFHCRNESEIAELQTLFNLIRPKYCQLEWDYSVSMLIELICVNGDQRERVEHFEQLQLLLAKRRGRTMPLRLGDAPEKLKQRSRTRFIYVRGIIASGIELWQQQIWLITKQVNRMLPLSKHWRDAIYIYTYDQLCDIAENIVAVIESTEHV